MLKTYTSVTLSVTLDVAYDSAFDYLVNPYHLPEWSINFIKQVQEVNGLPIAMTQMGDVPVVIKNDRQTGVLDIILGSVPSPTRLIRNGEGCDYLFTLHQPPNMPDVVWENEGVPGLREELDTLKVVLEGKQAKEEKSWN